MPDSYTNAILYRMSIWQKIMVNDKAISCLLIAAVLLITLMPAHYHLSHLFDDHLIDHAHVIDFHLITDKTDQSHHGEDTSVFTATPDGIVKKSNPDFSPFIFLAVLLVLFPIYKNRLRLYQDYGDANLKQNSHHFSTPLRAPPLHSF